MPSDEEVASLLTPDDAPSSFEGYSTKCFRLNVDAIWPEGGEFKWKLRGPKDFTRDALLALSNRLIIEFWVWVFSGMRA